MNNLTTAGDITYFTVDGAIYGIDATDNSAVFCHDEDSPAERIDYMTLSALLDIADVAYSDDYDQGIRIWHLNEFDLAQCAGEWYIERH